MNKWLNRSSSLNFVDSRGKGCPTPANFYKMQFSYPCPMQNNQLTTLANNRNVSKSSKILLALVVMSTTKSCSRAWYTYLTLSVSTNVCCLPVFISLGNAANRPSILARVISTNCLDTRTVKAKLLFGEVLVKSNLMVHILQSIKK